MHSPPLRHSLLLLPTAVAAHAELLETTPADGATVVGTPEELVAVFDDELVVDESSLSIRNAQGERLAVGGVDPNEPTHLLIADVPELAVGTYEMRWTAGTDDGHVERGTWRFTVAQASATPEPTETASPSAAATATASATLAPSATPAPTPSASAAPTDPTGAAGNDVILPIIAALAIVLIAAAALLSRRSRPPDGA